MKVLIGEMVNEKYKFSIVVPVYNVERYLDECVSSVLAQKYENYEVLLIDDGCTDGSGRRCDTWKEASERVKVIHQENAGSSEARNVGVQAAEGEYVLFLDSDDYWRDNNVLTRISERMERRRVDILTFNYEKIYGEEGATPYFNYMKNMPDEVHEEDSFCFLSKNDLWVASAWNKVIRRELFSKNDLAFRVGITSEDVEWCVRLALYGKSFDYIGESLLCYRQREGSITSVLTESKLVTLCKNVKACFDLLEESKDSSSNLLRPYVSYQYSVMLYGIAQIGANKELQRELISKAKEYVESLKWSNNKKVVLLRRAVRIVGFYGAMALLNKRAMVLRWRWGRR